MEDVLVQFYRGQFRCSLGYLRDLHGWQGQYDKLESNHLLLGSVVVWLRCASAAFRCEDSKDMDPFVRYIQWLFPNYFQSQFNSTAPLLSKPGARVFRSDAEIAGALSGFQSATPLASIAVVFQRLPMDVVDHTETQYKENTSNHTSSSWTSWA